MSTSEKILFVDDEAFVLDSMRRQLRNRFSLDTAQSGAEALEKCKTAGPYAVILSDMRMPGMDGIALLSQVKELYPETVRMMLTGNADQETASEAVNKGQIFRFLTKPCPMATLATSLALALRQHRLVTAERELLDKTLSSSIKVLAELLGYASPAAVSSSARIRPMVLEVGKALGIDKMWQLDVAALMSQIGCVTLPGDILAKRFANQELSPSEQELFDQYPLVGAELLGQIPRLEGVAHIIRNQMRPFSQFDQEDARHHDEDMGAQIIKAVADRDVLLSRGMEHDTVMKELFSRPDQYNPLVLERLARIRGQASEKITSLRVKELTVGMIVEEDIEALNGTLLASKGQEVTRPVIQGLINFSRQIGVKEPVRVRVKEQTDTQL